MDRLPTARPCWAEINTRSLEENYRLLRALAGDRAECLAIVKADAYGHGLALCAPAAVRAGAQWLGVTSVEEGVAARAVCPEARILVMGGVFHGQADAVVAHRLTPAVWEMAHLSELARSAAAAGVGALPVHLEIDTGMSRQGVSPTDLLGLLSRFNATGNNAVGPLRLEAVMTHLYASDEAVSARTTAQLEQLEAALGVVASASANAAPIFLSIGASAALLGGQTEALESLAARANLRPMLRLGLALYGVAPRFTPPFAPGEEPASLACARRELQPVLAWKTRIASVRTIAPGTEIGYNGTFIASETMRVALIPAGYADGLDRRLGNRFSVLVRGQLAPFVGRISMDQSVVDVTEIDGVQPGDEVVLLGSQSGQTISAYDHAEATGTIPWEVFTRIAARVPRVAV